MNLELKEKESAIILKENGEVEYEISIKGEITETHLNDIQNFIDRLVAKTNK